MKGPFHLLNHLLTDCHHLLTVSTLLTRQFLYSAQQIPSIYLDKALSKAADSRSVLINKFLKSLGISIWKARQDEKSCKVHSSHRCQYLQMRLINTMNLEALEKVSSLKQYIPFLDTTTTSWNSCNKIRTYWPRVKDGKQNSRMRSKSERAGKQFWQLKR